MFEMFDLEREFVSYLQTYGNTKESDLAEYGTRTSKLSVEDIKTVLDCMVWKGKAGRIFHDKLGPGVVYLSMEKDCLHGLAAEIEADVHDLKNKNAISEEAGEVLRAAATEAEKRIRKRFPEEFRNSRRKPRHKRLE